MIGIYRILNSINGKQYIGSSNNVKRRFRDHRWELNAGIHHSPHLQAAWRKYGKAAFKFEFLWSCHEDDLILEEQLALNLIPSEYNATPIAGRPPCEGRPHTDEAKSKIGAAHRGKVVSEEQRAKQRAAMTGRKHSVETKERCRRARSGRSVSEATRQKLAEKAKGRRHTEEARAKMSAAKRGRVISEEQREKISESMKSYRASTSSFS